MYDPQFPEIGDAALQIKNFANLFQGYINLVTKEEAEKLARVFEEELFRAYKQLKIYQDFDLAARFGRTG